MALISVQTNDFDISEEIARLKGTNNEIGAVVTFIGTVRDIGGSLQTMTLEHYPGMTEKELERIAHIAEDRWPLLGCKIIHRFGTLKPGDNIVLVITLSAHREAAFKAAEFLMDYLKSNAPFWKKESGADGENWVASKQSDQSSLHKWEKIKPDTKKPD